jgi:hypothetical protein
MNRSRTIVNKLNKKQPMGGGDGGSVLDRVGPRPAVALASAMIVTAVKDMRELRPSSDGRRGNTRNRIDATLWLVSRAATPWFDTSNVDQQYALDGMDWTKHARQVLDEHTGDLSLGQLKLLRDGISYLSGW